MLNIQKCIFAVSRLQNCVFFSSRVRYPKKRNQKKGEQKKTTQYHHDMMFGHNPGVQTQLDALGMTEQELKSPDVLEDLESQFWNADKVQDTIDREKYIHDELHGIYQVTRKQFKEEKSPNLLFWDEKQEIKALHADDPEKWTIMKLAFSYPASPSIIKKILKMKWRLRTPEEIEKHDQSVRRNWEALSKEKLHVPNEDLKKHLLTFSNRTKVLSSYCKEIMPHASKSISTDPLKTVLKDGGVFGNIYKSYKQLGEPEKERESSVDEEVDQSPIEKGLKVLDYPPRHDTFIIPRSAQNVALRTSRHLPLQDMKERVLQDFEEGRTLRDDEHKFIKDQLDSKIQASTYNDLRDPIGHTRQAELQEQLDKDNERESINNRELKMTVEVDLSVQEPKHNEQVHHHESPATPIEQKNVIASKFVDLSTVSLTQHKQDKELFSSLKTARIQRGDIDNDSMVKVMKDYLSTSSESYPLEIAIPKDQWRKGALYRVKDRFYTDEGDFLFRVPGLSKE